MKRLPLILLLSLAACNSEESDLFSFLEDEIEDAPQTRDIDSSDSTASSGISFILEPTDMEEEEMIVNL